MLSTIPSATLLGVLGQPVRVEVHVGPGLPSFTIVGLPDASVREARDRVRAALLSSGLEWPLTRVTVNLAPTALRKGGAGLDVPIAIGLLTAIGVIDEAQVEGFGFLGELGLDGTIRRVAGALPMVEAMGCDRVAVPVGNYAEAAALGGPDVRVAATLSDLVANLRCERAWADPPDVPAPPPRHFSDLADVRGHFVAKLALEVAAAGGHHLLMVGAPGSGKTMLANRLLPLLHRLSPELALEVTKIHSSAGERIDDCGLVVDPPLRAPHHSATLVSLVGGGTTQMRPGEVSLAHGGVLFLDELGEFPAHVLDALRQPLEDGLVRVTRAAASVEYPARCLLVAAMNPCPCGAGTPTGCRCTDQAIQKYARRVSGPLLDRFDLRIRVAAPAPEALLEDARGSSTAQALERVENARSAARLRGAVPTARLSADELQRVAPLSADGKRLLHARLDRGELSGRGLHRVWRVALTLNDLAGEEGVLSEQRIQQALSLRVDVAPALARVA